MREAPFHWRVTDLFGVLRQKVTAHVVCLMARTLQETVLSAPLFSRAR